MRLSMFVLLGLLLGTAPPVDSHREARDVREVVPKPPATVITGRVIDVNTERSLAGVQVFIENTGLGALTSSDGRYMLLVTDEGLVGTEIVLAARYIGYAEARETLTLSADGAEVDFTLAATAITLEEVVVSGTRSDGSRRVVGNSIGTISGRTPPAHRGTESYAFINENKYRSPYDAPLSTFSIDVDRASYSNVRRFISGGERPPIDAVRIEEMVNYFPYDYPEPAHGRPFSINTEVWAAPWNPAHRLVRVGIQGRRVDLEDLPPANIVFLLDVSGSMGSQNKLPLVQRSMRMLVDELRPQDRVAIVVYAGAAGLVLPSTPANLKERILYAIDQLHAGGSTAGGAGIELAYRVASENHISGGSNRVILATDGDFNVGASSDEAMKELIERKREQGTFLTVLGFGMGNLKDSKMETLADHGNGHYAYIDNLLEARKVLVNEVGGTLMTIAKDVKIQVEFNPERVASYRLIGYENRLLADEDFNNDRKDAGELGSGHSVTALYEVVPSRGASGAAIDPLRYQPTRRMSSSEESDRSGEFMFVKLRYKSPDGDRSRLIETAVTDDAGSGSVDLRFAASVAAFGMLLRGSEHSHDFTLGDVEVLARGAIGEDAHGYRSEFVRLVGATQSAELIASAR